ncbi:MAG: hypothetical protein JNK32_11490 [Anaerolineales bacterium]|nr:hypothetical protein [Anaerolineales bacterium]
MSPSPIDKALNTEIFLGHECVPLENGIIKLFVTKSIGPRVLGFGFSDSENIFAELPDFATSLPNGGLFHFYGGHRLWVAPEDIHITYIPDDEPVDISPLDNGLRIRQPIQTQIGLEKSLDILLTGETQVVITHKITNHGREHVTCAPWAITQLKTGGMAILPQAQYDAGVLPNRSLALWSYTNMATPNVSWGRNYILVEANMQSPFKVGFPNPRGWLAYWLNGTLFVKQASHDAEAQYYDFNSSSECYCNDKFLELETLAPISSIAPDETITHVETWNLYKDIECPKNESDVQSLIDKLGLE